MEDPGNIATLARWLEARDIISAFDPFEAPITLTKSAMQELARSERDEALTTVRRQFGKKAFFTSEQFETAIKKEVSYDTAARDDFSAWIRQRLRATSTSVKPATTKEEFRMPRRPSDGKRLRILRWRDYDGPEVEKVEDAQKQVEITKKILDAKTEELAEQLRNLRVIHGGANDGEAAE
jgi:LPS O-antigen subunit length determinant protein (WzzB/FepE family)